MSPVRFRPKTRHLRFTWIWAHRPSIKGSKLLFPVIKANQIKPREARFQETARRAVLFLRRQPRNFENVTIVARRREYFRGFLAIFLVHNSLQKKCLSTQEFSRFLSTVSSQKVIWVLGHCWVGTPVVCNKLFWKWNGVVWFVSQEVWFDKGFVIWHFRNYCLV